MKPSRTKPIAVCISDIHFNVTTLPVAAKSLRMAVAKAEALTVPLIIAGDLNDTKAIIRAEVANAIIGILKPAKIPVFILEGNHDKVNEKGEEHGLNYLRPYATVVDRPCAAPEIAANVAFLPYQNSIEKVQETLGGLDRGSIILMHQGVRDAFMGDYVQDKTSVDPELLKDFRCISGHYHRHQTIGTLTYIGSPYTITFGEANDPEKGFLVLNSDGTFERVLTGLRKHIIIETSIGAIQQAGETDTCPFEIPAPDDLVWLKVSGTASELAAAKKSWFAELLGRSSFKLDKIYTDAAQSEQLADNMPPGDILDSLIDKADETPEQRDFLKRLWREVLA